LHDVSVPNAFRGPHLTFHGDSEHLYAFITTHEQPITRI
jgi:hypothetical protein